MGKFMMIRPILQKILKGVIHTAPVIQKKEARMGGKEEEKEGEKKTKRLAEKEK